MSLTSTSLVNALSYALACHPHTMLLSPPCVQHFTAGLCKRVVPRTASQTYHCLLLLCPQEVFIHARCHCCRETDWRGGVVAEQPAIVAAATYPTYLLDLRL